MNEAKKCLKWLLLYSLLLAVNILPTTGVIPLRFPTNNISSLYLMILSACLILRYYKRISGQKNLKAAMQRLAIMVFLFFLLRGLKYAVFGNASALGRYTWYLYYLPMLCIPMLLFFVSLYVYAIDERQERRKWSWVAVVTALLILFVLTNDLHQQVFRFQPGFANWDGDYSHGWGFILISAWEYLLYAAAVAVLIAKCSISKIHYRVGLLLVPFAAGVAMVLLLTTGNMPKINGYNVIQFPEALCFMAAGVLECCIQLGLIPTNESYGELMRITSVPVQISDCNGNCIYQSNAAKELTAEQLISPDKTRIAEHTLLRRMEIPGGYGFWQEDVTELDYLNEELADAKDRLSEEAELIRLQNELEQKQTIIEQRSYVYDTIAKRTQKQSQRIAQLADEAIESSDMTLTERNRKQITLLGAYIKRYANLALLSADNKVIDAGELALSVSEVLRYLNPLGVSVEVLNRSRGRVPAGAVLSVFEVFQTIIENNLFFLSGVTANFSDRNNGVLCRLTLEGLQKNLLAEEMGKLSSVGVITEAKYEDEITYLSFLLPEGGVAV